jgi:hypothetical protein
MHKIASVILLATTLAGCGGSAEPAREPASRTHEPIASKELVITDLSVVNDPRAVGDGPWSFGGLMSALSGTQPSGQFILDWLRSWEADQTVNSFTVAARPNIRTLMIEPWKAKDGAPGLSDARWTPDLANAPFRLLAIVNRLDLLDDDGGTIRDAGEGRFIFGAVDRSGSPLPFTVIFEYEQRARDPEALAAWARRWHALGTREFGPDFNAALQAITDDLSAAGASSAGRIEALRQIRTNEIALVSPADVNRGWEMREFRFVGGRLRQVPVAQTPANAFQNTPRLARLINDNEAPILAGSITVPTMFDGAAFLAGSAIAAPPAHGFFWRAPGINNNEARHIAAFNTCSGCHHMETGTRDFLHVKNRTSGAQSALSSFLTGAADVPDPLVTSTRRRFNDLADRAEILASLVAGPDGLASLPALQKRRARVH